VRLDGKKDGKRRINAEVAEEERRERRVGWRRISGAWGWARKSGSELPHSKVV